MAGPGYLFNRPFIPSAAITQYRVVKITAADTVTTAAAGTDKPIGVCTEEITTADVTNGRVAAIAQMGTARCIAGAAITAGATVASDASGRVVAAVATNFPVGIALQAAAAAGDHIDVFLTIGGVVI
jgi:hypothetical protein